MKCLYALVGSLIAAGIGVAGAEMFDVRDAKNFDRIVPKGAVVQKLAGDLKFTEGPVWIPQDAGFLVFSDIPANELKRWDEVTGLRVFRQPSQNANGNTLDKKGRLVSAEHGARRISLTEKDGSIITLVEAHDGKKLNSPNDVIVRSDGTIWFTDPDYGLAGRPKEQAANHVFSFDPESKLLTVVASDFDKPNGLCFDPKEKKLYVADSGKPRNIRVFEFNVDGSAGDPELFCAIDNGGPDGIRCDERGRLYSSAGDGVHIFGADGKLIGKILVPESPANLCFGGKDGRTLYITARTSLYAINLSVQGAGF